MPRLRVVKKPEDSADIPQDQAVQVVLSDDSAETPEITPGSTSKEPQKAPELDPGDSAIAALQKQMEDMKKAHESAIQNERQQVQEADRQRQEAIQRANQKDQELTKVGTRAEAAEFDAILAAMGAAQAESESAQRDIEIGTANSDIKLQIDAQKRLARAESRMGQLEDSKASYEARQERKKTEPPPRETPIGDPIDAHIDAMPNLTVAQRQWLKSHRELMTDNRKNVRLQNAHFDAEDAGIKAGSDEYFKFLDEKLGYRKADPKPQEDDEEDDMPEDDRSRPGIVSAPPSRENRSMDSGKPSNSRITLSPEQREAARNAGVDEVTYAKNLVKLNTFKKDGHYSHN